MVAGKCAEGLHGAQVFTESPWASALDGLLWTTGCYVPCRNCQTQRQPGEVCSHLVGHPE